MIRETLEQQRRVFESFQFLGRGQPPLARSGHRESAVKHNEEFHHSTRHTLGPAYSEFNRHNPRRDVSHVHAIYDPQDMGDFLYDPASQLSPTDPNGIQGLFIQDSLALLEKRIRDFKEMNDRASDLEIWVSSPITVPAVLDELSLTSGISRISKRSTPTKTAKKPPSSPSPLSPSFSSPSAPSPVS